MCRMRFSDGLGGGLVSSAVVPAHGGIRFCAGERKAGKNDSQQQKLSFSGRQDR